MATDHWSALFVTNMNHANARKTEKGDMLKALQRMMEKIKNKDSESAVMVDEPAKGKADEGEDYQLMDFEIGKSQPGEDPSSRLLRSLVPKGMSADVDETIQEEADDPQAVQINALKKQLRTFQTQLNALQKKLRSTPKEGENEPSLGGEDYEGKVNEKRNL